MDGRTRATVSAPRLETPRPELGDGQRQAVAPTTTTTQMETQRVHAAQGGLIKHPAKHLYAELRMTDDIHLPITWQERGRAIASRFIECGRAPKCKGDRRQLECDERGVFGRSWGLVHSNFVGTRSSSATSAPTGDVPRPATTTATAKPTCHSARARWFIKLSSN